MDLNGRQARVGAAINASNRGDFTTAKDVVIDLVTEDWNCAESHKAWGRVLLDQNLTTDAVAAFRTATELDPSNAELHFELASALVSHAERADWLQLTFWIDARAAVLAGLELEPDSFMGKRLLSVIEEQRKRVLD